MAEEDPGLSRKIARAFGGRFPWRACAGPGSPPTGGGGSPRWLHFWLALCLPVILTTALLLLGACVRVEREPPDPLAPYRLAMREEFEADLMALESAPRYALDITLDPGKEILTGTAQIRVVNYSQEPWRSLVFRLYPMLEQYGGQVTLFSVLVDGFPANYVYMADNTAIRIDLKTPLPGGRALTVDFAWRLNIPVWSDTPQVYALLGRSQGMTSLPLFYPSLAVYQPGPVMGAGRWWTEIGSVRGDAAFNVASLFVVTATLPADEIPVATGSLITATQVAPDRRQYVWVTGPVREFVLHMSPLFRQASEEAYGVQVTSYWLPGQEAAGRAALQYGVSALRIYSDLFAPYPFRTMSLAPAPLTYRGMEYPQVNLLGVELYGRYISDLEILVAHEVAHQWWYQIVHNDPVNAPWLDEALAEYAVKLYLEELYGSTRANLLQRQRWQAPVDLLVEQGRDAPLDRPVASFDDNRQYETVIYAKGALLYDQIRQTVGDRRFRRFLQEYLADHRYGIVDTATWQDALQALQNPSLETLTANWVTGPGTPRPTPTPVGPLTGRR